MTVNRSHMSYLYHIMNNSLIGFCFLLLIIPSLNSNESKKREFEDKDLSIGLCEPPVVINSANTYPNRSIRLYKEDNWYELKGLPDREGFISMNGSNDFPFKAFYGSSKVTSDVSIVTVLSGDFKGQTYCFKKNYVWYEFESEIISYKLKDVPKNGFSAVFHTGDRDDPLFIGFRDNMIYTMVVPQDSKEFELVLLGNRGYVNTDYPNNIDAAFVRVIEDWSYDKRELYLFRGQQYCVRSVRGQKKGEGNCSEWRENAELFGCLSQLTTSLKSTETIGTEVPETEPGKVVNTKQAIVAISSTALLFVILALNQIFYF